MNTAAKIEVMQAFEDGEQIEFKSNGCKHDYWSGLGSSLWDWVNCTYRVKPEPNLEDRVKAEYGGFEVVMLEWEEHTDDLYRLSMIHKGCNWAHIEAQSMRNFNGYVYLAHPFTVKPMPVTTDNGMVQPCAVLFSKAQS